MSDRIRHFASLNYCDTRKLLINLRDLEVRLTRSDLPRKVRTLRTHELKEWRELREAALFCHFIGELIGKPVSVARGESQDYDAVAKWPKDSETTNFTPIQIKEVVPAFLNPNANLTDVISKLSKYVDSSDLTVAIHLNRMVTFDLAETIVPALPIAELWVFGSISADATRWRLWGNLLRDPHVSDHTYPTLKADEEP